jgi:GR25 family glycosyltransferase involved in LPS biosynthesis
MNNYIDNVYLINMDKDTDRLEKVKKECDIVDIKFERFPGVKIADLSKNILDKYIPENIQKYGTNGMIGCGLSHLFIWEDAIKKNYKNILVLEDDVYFTDDFKEYFINVIKEVPDDYDILYLGYKDSVCEAPKDSSFNYIYKPYFPLLTHAMIISNKGLKKLKSLIVKIDDHIDWLIANNNKKLNIYVSKKKIVNQIWKSSNNSTLNNFPKIINFYLDQVYDCHNIPQSYEYNFQMYKYKDYKITRMTYNIFHLGLLANIHYSILFLCLLYFFCDYDRFHLIIFLLGYCIGNVFKHIMNYCKVNQYAILFLLILFVLFLNKINLLFTLIKLLF